MERNMCRSAEARVRARPALLVLMLALSVSVLLTPASLARSLPLFSPGFCDFGGGQQSPAWDL